MNARDEGSRVPIVIASFNRGKLKEFSAMMPRRLEVRAQSDFDVPEIEETGQSFIENAILKARNACHHSGLPAFADDSGLEVDALGGRPGVRSARYAGAEASDEANVLRLLEELKGTPEAQRTARFHCVIAFLRSADDPHPVICEGTWEGWIQHSPSGDNGFGYDPVFHVPTHHCSAAELDGPVKNRLSHRFQAMAKLVNLLEELDITYPH